MKRLKSPSGQISDNVENASDASDKVVRPAILVHAGPEGTEMTFLSGDGEIKFDDARIQRVVDNHNAQINALAQQYGGLDKMPAGAFPPILDAHENDSNNRVVGRLSCLLKFERRDVPGVGKNVACAVADPGITFLGQDTVSRVKDGRIYHLSIGIDEKTDLIGETSTVIEPAAPGAMLLTGKGGNKNKTLKGDAMPKKDLKRLKRHTDRMSKLAAIDGEFTTLTKKSVSTKELIQLNGRQREVTHRLKKLMSDFKLSPVEFKKLDITKLSKMENDSLDMVLSAYEARPKLEGVQRGSADAADFSEIGKNLEKRQMKRLKAEIKGDFKRLGKKLEDEDKDHGDTHEMGGGNKEHEVNPGKDPHSVPGQEGDEQQLAHLASYMEKMKSHLEAGDVEGAKKAHEEMAAHLGSMKHLAADGLGVGDVKSEDEKKSFEHLQSQVDEVHTNLARLAGMVKELMEAEKEEGHDLEAGYEENKDEPKPGDKAS